MLGKVAITDDEARAYYEAHLNEFTTPPTVTLREILVAVPADPKGVNVAADDAAKEKAATIRARAVGGESFEKLAADVSDAPSRANAGLIGPISAKDLSPDFQKLIETMKAGDVSEPFARTRGYQILKLESTTGAQTLTFEQAREQISDRVLAGKRQQEFQKLLEKLRAEAIIEWKNADIKKAYERGTRAAKTSDVTDAAGPTGATRSGSPSGRGRATKQSSASSSSASTSTRSCRRSRGGAAGRIARRRSTGRCFPATASRASIRPTRCRFSSAPASSTSSRSREGRRRFPSTSSTASAC